MRPSIAAIALLTGFSIATETIYSTEWFTITSCGPEVSNCPGRATPTSTTASTTDPTTPPTTTPVTVSIIASAPVSTSRTVSTTITTATTDPTTGSTTTAFTTGSTRSTTDPTTVSMTVSDTTTVFTTGPTITTTKTATVSITYPTTISVTASDTPTADPTTKTTTPAIVTDLTTDSVFSVTVSDTTTVFAIGPTIGSTNTVTVSITDPTTVSSSVSATVPTTATTVIPTTVSTTRSITDTASNLISTLSTTTLTTVYQKVSTITTIATLTEDSTHGVTSILTLVSTVTLLEPGTNTLASDTGSALQGTTASTPAVTSTAGRLGLNTDSHSTIQPAVQETGTATLSLCPSRILNPTYTPATPLPVDYTWGCPPGTLCQPDRPNGCNFEVGPPADTYICNPHNCKPLPPQHPPQNWSSPDPHTWKYIGSEDYFNPNPIFFGLSYGILVFPPGDPIRQDQPIEVSGTDLIQRDQLIEVPGQCYALCNDAMLLAEKGKNEELCAPQSGFRKYEHLCMQCIEANGPLQFSTGILPQFQQFIFYCDVVFGTTTPVQSATWAASRSSNSTAYSTPLPTSSHAAVSGDSRSTYTAVETVTVVKSEPMPITQPTATSAVSSNGQLFPSTTTSVVSSAATSSSLTTPNTPTVNPRTTTSKNSRPMTTLQPNVYSTAPSWQYTSSPYSLSSQQATGTFFFKPSTTITPFISTGSSPSSFHLSPSQIYLYCLSLCVVLLMRI